jgi:hypothetical protein
LRTRPVILWRNEGEDAVIARHLAEHPGDAKKRIHVVMWRRPNEESAAAAIARKLDEDAEDATRRTDSPFGGPALARVGKAMSGRGNGIRFAGVEVLAVHVLAALGT